MRKKIIIILVVMMLALTSPFTSVLAAQEEDENTPTESTAPNPEETSADDSASGVDGGTELTEQTPVLKVGEGDYISTSSFTADHYMVGLFSVINEGFNLGMWDIHDAQFTLSFSTTQLVSEVLSDITISVNGVRFYSERVPVTDGTRRELTVKIPVEHLVEGYNYISIEGYIRTYNGLPCVDDVTTANWMNVFKESFIEIAYSPLQTCSSIDEFYSCFTSIDALENSQSAVVLPTNYTIEEISAAFKILAGISSKAVKYYENIELLAADKLTNIKGKKYVIYVAKSDNISSYILPEGVENLTGSQAELILSQGDMSTLVVSGDNDAALSRAAALFGDATTMSQLKGTTKIINEDEDIYTRKEGVKQYTKITETGTYLDGAFRQKADFFIDFPNNRKLAYGSEATVYFRYSENLDFDRSLVSIYVNGVPIGSKKLSQAQAEGDSLTVNIPTDIKVTGSFVITIAFDLEIKDLWCTLRQTEMPWAYITSDSMLKLNSVEVPYFLFENYPYPFISGGEFNDVVFVIPDSNNDLDLKYAGGFMLTIGQYLKYNTGNFVVSRASVPGDLEGKNIITMGTFLDNPFIASLNENMFFKFYDNGAGIMSNEKLYLESFYSMSLGTAQLIQSPYSTTKNAVLLIASADKKYTGNSAKYFTDTKELWKLYGDGFVADKDDIYLYRFKEEEQLEEELAETIFERADVMNLIYISAAIFAMLLVGILFLLIRYRRTNDYEKK